MSYELLVEKRAVEEFRSLPNLVQERIKGKIRTVLKEDPFPGGKGDIKRIKGSGSVITGFFTTSIRNSGWSSFCL